MPPRYARRSVNRSPLRHLGELRVLARSTPAQVFPLNSALALADFHASIASQCEVLDDSLACEGRAGRRTCWRWMA